VDCLQQSQYVRALTAANEFLKPDRQADWSSPSVLSGSWVNAVHGHGDLEEAVSDWPRPTDRRALNEADTCAPVLQAVQPWQTDRAGPAWF